MKATSAQSIKEVRQDATRREGLFERFQIPSQYAPWVEQSWNDDEHTIYGRFDLAYDGKTPPKAVAVAEPVPAAGS